MTFSFTSYILCFFFFFKFPPPSTSFLPSYYLACLSPSIFLSTSTSSSPHNSTSVPYSSFSFVPYPYLLSNRRRRHPNGFRLHPPLIAAVSSFHQTILDPTPSYNLIWYCSCPCFLLSPPAHVVRHDTTNYDTVLYKPTAPHIPLFFNTLFSIPSDPFIS